ncbi:MAG: putative pyridoxine 5'-phosphate oxidase superfamily flavin-nucleotide-binding protein [Planctomycetota bacterium]|jgi:predicted pyridoxine 5'-phosphate oxidase superfamily flavin-nucleotide-binding protein
MARKYPSITFTDSVRAAQADHGAAEVAARVEAMQVQDDRFSENEKLFIRARDSFYMASVNEDGWPYIQHRGGPLGFLKVTGDRSLAFADFSGNRQYISTGNIRHDDRVALFLMDYPNRTRLKLMLRSEILDAAEHPDLLELVQDSSYKARIERIVQFKLEAFDWNCPQHITPRFTEQEWSERQD